MNLDKMPQAYLWYWLGDGRYEVFATLPEGVTLTAGEIENDFAVCDISHWTQDDMNEFDSLDEADRFAIVESLEFGEFARKMDAGV